MANKQVDQLTETTSPNNNDELPIYDSVSGGELKKIKKSDLAISLAHGYNVKDYGAKGDGSTDDTSSINSALSAVIANGSGILYFPAGKYIITSSLSFAIASGTNSISWLGDGQDATVLHWPNAGGGITANLSNQQHSVHFKGITFTTAQNNSGTAITVNQTSPLGYFAMNTFRDLTFRGNTVGTNYWKTCAYIYNTSGTTWDGITMYGNGATATSGTGIHFAGAGGSSNNYSIYHNISKSTFNALTAGVLYDTYTQGVTISQSNFQNGYVGIWITSGCSGLAQLNVTDNQFAQSFRDILIQSPISPLTIRGNVLFTNGVNTCIDLQQGVNGTIVGNYLYGDGTSGSYGLYINNLYHAISNNIIANFTYGIYLGNSSGSCKGAQNIYYSNTQNVTDKGTSNSVT